MKIGIINGPNLNLLGIRKPEIYGSNTLDDVCAYIKEAASDISKDIELDFFQSNSEGALIDRLHALAFAGFDAVILNAGAYTHYSYALRDAVEAVSDMNLPVWEVHLSDVENREDFRKISVIREVCRGCVFGLGRDSYTKALREAVGYISERNGSRS